MSAPDMSIFANMMAARAATQQDDTPILTFVDESTDTVLTRTYKELYRNANALACFLLEQGMVKGDRFAALLRNHPEMVEALIAASITGCVIVPIDPRTRGDKLAYMLSDSASRGILCADYNASEVTAVAANTGLEWSLVVAAGTINKYDLPAAEDIALVLANDGGIVEVRVDSPLDTLQILYTSGTTGDPKGIIKPNNQFAVGGAMAQIIGLQQDDVLYTGLSLTHGNAQGFTLAVSLAANIPSVYSLKFTKSGLWKTVRRFGCTVFNLLGGMTAAIYADPRLDNDADNPVRLVISAGMPAAIWEDFEQRFCLQLFEVYGAAEGGLFWNDGSGPAGSFGLRDHNPLFEARVLDSDGNDCRTGVCGELIWRNRDGSQVSVDYLNNPAASEKKTAEGWFRTGDIVHADENGWLYFDYRDGGGIRRNGDFINPGFVEKALAEMDAVDDVFVYGVPSSNGTPGEKDVVAAIVASNTVNFDPTEVFAGCREKLESSFVPSYLQVVDEIPKTASEKPQERFLLDAFSVDADNVFSQRSQGTVAP
jgi:crotonobetaine/carnitine-CoA ligase